MGEQTPVIEVTNPTTSSNGDALPTGYKPLVEQERSVATAPEAVRKQLERILQSSTFLRSKRLGRFLTFTVEQYLQGRQSSLKEYLVGVEVFNKLESFDPRIDSIVRVEARRLRSKLDRYYQTEGRDDTTVIQFRKGSYVPMIMTREEMARSIESDIVGTRSGKRGIA